MKSNKEVYKECKLQFLKFLVISLHLSDINKLQVEEIDFIINNAEHIDEYNELISYPILLSQIKKYNHVAELKIKKHER